MEPMSRYNHLLPPLFFHLGRLCNTALHPSGLADFMDSASLVADVVGPISGHER